MTIINANLAPYTSEYFLIGTGCSESLSTANYFISTGFGRGYAANMALIHAETVELRFKLNGSAAATSCGHLLYAGDYLVLDDPAQMAGLRLLNETDTATSYAHITYFAG